LPGADDGFLTQCTIPASALPVLYEDVLVD
jgi:hypothetical protein